MCGFFSLQELDSDTLDSLNLVNPELVESIGFGTFYPKKPIPTISQNSPNKLVLRYWQLIPPWFKGDYKQIKFSTFNARAENIATKPTFKNAWLKAQRCLVPMNWFYEYGVEGANSGSVKKNVYKVSCKDDIFMVAGLWESWQDADNNMIDSCTIITCNALEPLKNIHNRQPVVIARPKWEQWLNPDTNLVAAYNLLKPVDDLIISPKN